MTRPWPLLRRATKQHISVLRSAECVSFLMHLAPSPESILISSQPVVQPVLARDSHSHLRYSEGCTRASIVARRGDASTYPKHAPTRV